MTVLDRPAELHARNKVRRPATVAILTVVTLGLYSIVWYYKINREMCDFGATHGDPELGASRPWRSLIAVTLGGPIVVPRLISFVRTVRRLQAVERLVTGRTQPARGLMLGVSCAALLPLGGSVHRFGPLISLAGFTALVTVVSLIQIRLNRAWHVHAATHGDLVGSEPDA